MTRQQAARSQPVGRVRLPSLGQSSSPGALRRGGCAASEGTIDGLLVVAVASASAPQLMNSPVASSFCEDIGGCAATMVAPVQASRRQRRRSSLIGGKPFVLEAEGAPLVAKFEFDAPLGRPTLLQSRSGRFANERLVKRSFSIGDNFPVSSKVGKDRDFPVYLCTDIAVEQWSEENWRVSLSQPLGGPDRKMGLIRLIYDEARKIHMQRETYLERAASQDVKFRPREILMEICGDVKNAVRRCLHVYRPIRFMYIGAQGTAQRRLELRDKTSAALSRVRLKVIFIGVLLKAYRRIRLIRHADDPAEQLWQRLSDSLDGLIDERKDSERESLSFKSTQSCREGRVVPPRENYGGGRVGNNTVAVSEGDGTPVRKCHSEPVTRRVPNRPQLPPLPLPLPMQRF